MDTEAIASEIVSIRNRLNQIDEQMEGTSDSDTDDERATLTERLRHLQDLLSGGGDSRKDGSPHTDTLRYVRPA